MATQKTKDPFDAGREQFRGGDYPGAVDSLTRALATDPLRSEAYRLRALARAALRDSQGSESDFAKAFETSTLVEAAEALYVDRGISRLGRGDRKGARLDLQRALAIDAKDPRAIEYLKKLDEPPAGEKGGAS